MHGSHGERCEVAAGARFGYEGRFQVLRELGRGHSGCVLLAFDHVLGRNVAVKFLLPRRSAHKDAEALAEEARIIARLTHPFIVGIHDFGEHDGIPYLVMEYVEGGSLDAVLAGAPLEVLQALRIAINVAHGIAHAHSADVLHLDVKPGNVLLSQESQVKVIDFGVSAALASSKRHVPPDDAVMGTPEYMAPEQWHLSALDERTDIWALGVLLYEMLVGMRPFESKANLAARAALVSSEDSVLWRPLHAVCPKAVPCVRRALAWERQSRTPSVRELIDELQGIVSEFEDRPGCSRRSAGEDETRSTRLLRGAPHTEPNEAREWPPLDDVHWVLNAKL